MEKASMPTNLPDWIMAAAMVIPMCLGAVIWVMRLPTTQKQQQLQLDRIERKLDAMDESLVQAGIKAVRGLQHDQHP